MPRSQRVQASIKPVLPSKAHPRSRARMRVRGVCRCACWVRACAPCRHSLSCRAVASVFSLPTSWAPSGLRAACAPPAGSEPPSLAQGHNQEGFNPGGETAQRPPEGFRRGKAGSWESADLERSARAQTRLRSPADCACPAAHTPPQRRHTALRFPRPLLGTGLPEPCSWSGRCPGRMRAGAGRAAPPGENNEAALRTGPGAGGGAWSHFRAVEVRPPRRRLSDKA